MSTPRTSSHLVSRRPAGVSLAVAVAVGMLATGCGSQLTEAQVLSRSGAQTTTSDSGGAQQTTGAGQLLSSGSSGGLSSGPASHRPGAGTTGGGTSATASRSGTTTGTGAAGTSGSTTGSPSGAGCTTKGSGPIKIASVGNYSGPGGASQGRFPTAVQVWAAAQNARGGLCGRPVQVLVADDGGDPSSYAAKIKDMVENQHVVAFVSNGAVLSASGGEAYHKKSGVPVIGNDCGSRFYFTEPIYAPTCSSVSQAIVNIVRVGVKLSGKQKLGLLYCREADACASINEVVSNGGAQAGGAQLAYKASISLAQIDFTAECQNARAAGVDLMFVAADAATMTRVAQSCARQGYRPQNVAAGLSLSGETTKVDGLKNIIVSSNAFPFTGANSPAIAEYEKARAQYAPDVTPDPGYAIAWTGAKLFELLATRAAKASGDITPAALRAALLTVKGETLGGLTPPLTYTSSGSTGIKDCYFAMQGDGNGGMKAPFGASAQCTP
jgi:branched-chain amino acid transport system substrate-binding protein